MDKITWEFAKYAAELYFEGHSLEDSFMEARKLMNKGAANKAKREALRQGQAKERIANDYFREARQRSKRMHIKLKGQVQ